MSIEDWDAMAEELLALPAREGLTGAINLLEVELRRAKVGSATLLRDVVACDFAAQVLEAGKGVRVVYGSDAERVGYPIARRGFEAFHELMHLLAVAPDGEGYAADAIVLTVFSIADNRSLLDRFAARWDPTAVSEGDRSARDVIMESAQALGLFSPSARAAVLAALARRERKGSQKRLDGARKSRIEELAGHSDLGPMASMLQAYWGTLSMQAHPHVRLGSSVRLTPNGLTILLNPEERDEGPVKVGLATTFSAARLCRKHLHPDRSA